MIQSTSLGNVRLPHHEKVCDVTRTDKSFWHSIAHIGIQVAEALDYAHRQGFVHRYVKPSNLLLDEQGIVWVTDFGLTKTLEDADGLTQTGEIVGTIRYLAPETFSGDIDGRSDIYSLGLTLYEFVTLRRAFDAPDKSRLLIQVTHEEPPQPRHVNPEIPRVLETIILKATDREPSHRYSSSRELAEDLQRFLRNEPIKARRVGLLERGIKWSKRHPAAAALWAVIVVATSMLVGGAIWHDLQLRGALSETEKERTFATEQQALSEQRADTVGDMLYAADVKLAGEALKDGDVRATTELLRRHSANADGTDRREFVWHYLYQHICSDFQSLPILDDNVFCIRYSPDGKYVFVGSGDGSIRIVQTSDVKVVATLRGHEVGVFDIAVTPNGSVLASIDWKGVVRLWDVASQKESRSFIAHDDKRYCGVAFGLDGKILLTCGSTSHVKIWDTATGRQIGTLEGHNDAIEAIACSHDGQFCATASRDRTARLWDLKTKQQLFVYRGHTSRIPSVRFSRDGKQLATCSLDKTVRI